MSATLEEVAARAGVSAATVSRVVNGRAGVATGTRSRVLAVLDELGYEPPGLGRLRPRARSGMIGLVVPELVNPVFPAFAQAIEARLAPRGMNPVLCTTNSSGVRESEYVEALLELDVAGMVFVSCDMNDLSADHAHYGRIHDQGVPMVFLNGRVEHLAVPTVRTDEREAARLAVQHLAALGHARLAAIVGPLRYLPAVDKRDGFEEACAQAGIVEHWVESADWGVEGGHAAMRRLLRRPIRPTGVICASDLMAIGAIAAIREEGLSVPADVSVIGYDNSMLARHGGPPLTTVSQAIERMAETTVNLLLNEIAGHADRAEPLSYLFRPELVVRETTSPPCERT